MAQPHSSHEQQPHQQQTESYTTRLNETDQKRVDEFTSSGVNSTERPNFRPWLMMLWLAASIIGLGLIAQIVGYLYAY